MATSGLSNTSALGPFRRIHHIPPKSNRSDPICFSPYLYRARNRVERFFNRIKQCRRVATRYDRLAANYLAFVQLASIRLWLRLKESAS
jgi:transposase